MCRAILRCDRHGITVYRARADGIMFTAATPIEAKSKHITVRSKVRNVKAQITNKKTSDVASYNNVLAPQYKKINIV